MPELPEVETIVRDLQLKVLNRAFIDVWTDTPKIVKIVADFNVFKKEIKNKVILKVQRRAKNIIFELSGDKILLIHLKMTGHLLYGKWKMVKSSPMAEDDEILRDKINSYVHLMFYLDNGFMLALSDLRKFAKVELWNKKDFFESKEYNSWGPEPLEKDFTFEVFSKIIKSKRGKIKSILMDPKVIAGIGNIYADEILWFSKIHPERTIQGLSEKDFKEIYKNIKLVLELAVSLRGTSVSDYRDTAGKTGMYGLQRKVYQREGEKCFRCGTIIKKIKIGQRSACFCPNCQKIRSA